MTMTIAPTSLCICRHVASVHTSGAECTQPGCRCPRFAASNSRPPGHRQRTQEPLPRRVTVAQVKIGDVVLVGYPGRYEHVRDAAGFTTWAREPGTVTSVPVMRHFDDRVLRTVDRRHGALLAKVTGHHILPAPPVPEGRRRPPIRHLIETELGTLPPLFGTNVVLVVTP